MIERVLVEGDQEDAAKKALERPASASGFFAPAA